MDCNKCGKALRGDNFIACDGVCQKRFHVTPKCAGLDEYSLNVLNKPMVRFMCDNCIQLVHNVDEVLRDMQSEMKKNGARFCEELSDYKKHFQTAIEKSQEALLDAQQSSENELKSLLINVEKKFSERLIAMQEVKKVCENGAIEVGKISQIAEEIKTQNAKVCEEIENNNKESKKICDELKMIKDSAVQISDKCQPSYADIAKVNKTKKSEKVLPELRKEVPLLIMPKKKQNSATTKQDLREKVNPANLKISNVHERNNGTIVIETDCVREREKIKSAVENAMKEQYDIKIPSVIKPRFTIPKISYKYTDEEIVEKLKNQNQCLGESELKLAKVYETKSNNITYYSAIFEADPDTFTKVMQAGKLNIGWETRKVYDGTDVMMCFKCLGYNHRAPNCRSEEICRKCLQNHKTSECDSEPQNKCINCIRAKEKLSLDINENHSALDKKCPTYLFMLEQKKKKIYY